MSKLKRGQVYQLPNSTTVVVLLKEAEMNWTGIYWNCLCLCSYDDPELREFMGTTRDVLKVTLEKATLIRFKTVQGTGDTPKIEIGEQ